MICGKYYFVSIDGISQFRTAYAGIIPHHKVDKIIRQTQISSAMIAQRSGSITHIAQIDHFFCIGAELMFQTDIPTADDKFIFIKSQKPSKGWKIRWNT